MAQRNSSLEEAPLYEAPDPSQEGTVAQLLDDLSVQLSNHHIGLLASARTFVPDIIADAITKDHLQEDELIVSRTQGAVVFSDASGFTALTERLAQKSNGAELLSSNLNKFFTPLIDTLTAYRGDIIKFSGDALTILFAATNDYEDFVHACGSPSCSHAPLELACLRASACCIEIHKRLHNFDTGEGVKLTLHIGVGAGPVTILQVGGDKGRYEYVIAGQPLEQIAVAEPLAGSGETVLSPECWGHVCNTVIEGPPIVDRPDYHRLVALDVSKHTYPTIKQAAQQSNIHRRNDTNPADIEPEQLERCLAAELRFIPQCVVKQFRTGSLRGINEMRVVSVIFVQIGGVDVSTDEGALKAQQLMMGMQALCYTEEGNLNKFLVDDKGLLFLFVFGLPPLVHIDDPSRACRACLEMTNFLVEMGLTGRIGITTGRAFCGIVGSNTRREYTVMGDTVNLSARLMASAQANTVLLDEVTYQRCRNDFTFVKLDPIKVKGKEKKIVIYRPLGSQKDVEGFIGHPGLVRPLDNLWTIAAKRAGGESVRIALPWPPKGVDAGGKSPVAQIPSWFALQRVREFVENNLVEPSGLLVLHGESGCGKEELVESIVDMCVKENKMLPIFGTMQMRVRDRFEAVREIICSVISLLAGNTDLTERLSEAGFIALINHEACGLSEEERDVLEDMENDTLGRQLMTRVASGSKTVDEGGRAGLDKGFRRRSILDNVDDLVEASAMSICRLTVNLVSRLLDKCEDKVVIILRCWRRTTLFPCDDGVFWELVRQLGDLATQTEPGKLLVIVMCRIPPVVSDAESWGNSSEEEESVAAMISSKHTVIEVEPLTNEEAHIFIGLCLGIGNADEPSHAVPDELREWTSSMTMNNPRNMQEAIAQLFLEDKVRLNDGNIEVLADLSTVDIAAWVHTGMVGNIISQVEVMDAEAQRVIKMASVLDGPLSALDIAAANKAHRPESDLLAFYDSVQLLLACEWLVEQQFLTRFYPPPNEPPEDGQTDRLPRWVISNLLIRKVVASTLLESQKIYMKRAVLVSRRLNISLPGKMREKAALREEIYGKQSEAEKARLQKRREAAWEMQASLPKGLGEQSYSGLPSSCIVLPQRKACNIGIEPDVARQSSLVSFSPDMQQTWDQSQFVVARAGDLEASQLMDWTHLMCAASHGNRVGELLEKRANVSWRDSALHTPLHFACWRGDLDLVKLLVQAKADADALSESRSDGTPLDLAAAHGHLNVMQFLVEHEAAAWDTSAWKSWREHCRPLKDVPPPLPVATLIQPFAASSRLDLANFKRSQLLMFLQDVVVLQEDDEENLAEDQAAADKKAGQSVVHQVQRLTLAQRILDSRPLRFLMSVSVLFALFAPDAWVLFDGTQQVLDTLLFCAMVVLTLEMVLWLITEPQYGRTAFFAFDFLGTVAIAFDISWILGSSWSEPLKADDLLDGRFQMVASRAARCAMLGTRAMRYPWVARLLNVVCICCLKTSETGNYGGVETFRAQIMHSIATHVAALTVVLLVSVPLLRYMTHPKLDMSMAAWTEVLSRDASSGSANLSSEFKEFHSFYEDRDYGPYHVCRLTDSEHCGVNSTLWGYGGYDHRAHFTQPEVEASRVTIRSSYLSASFDFTSAREQEARMNIALLVSSCFIMVVTTLIINRTVSDLVLRPLQRMLASVKEIAQPIFGHEWHGNDETADDDEFNDCEDELHMLLKVVQKLSKIAGIATQLSDPKSESMKDLEDGDRGFLQMMFEQDKGDENMMHQATSRPSADRAGPYSQLAMKRLETLKITYEELDSWDLNVLKLERNKMTGLTGWLILANTSAFGEVAVVPDVAATFLQTLIQNYGMDTPFHNWTHAVDVSHTMWRMLTISKAHTYFSGLEQFALLVSAISHDVGHLGVNNQFLVETGHELAVRYNDHSPLENMHCAKMFEIVSATPGANIFESLSRPHFFDARRICIASILHTDNVHHFALVQEAEMIYQLHSDALHSDAEAQTDLFDRLSREKKAKQQVMNFFLHSADVSNPCKPWEQCYDWAMRCLAEFFNQGDKEKQLGIPMQPLNDRTRVNKPFSQIGFIQFMIVPLEAAKTRLFPALYETTKMLDHNLSEWLRLWVEETEPAEQEKQKLLARVQKASQTLADACENVMSSKRQQQFSSTHTTWTSTSSA